MDTQEEVLPTNIHSFSTPIPLQEDQTKTIKAIKQTLKDLQNQQQAIAITIDTLTQSLKFLLNTKRPR